MSAMRILLVLFLALCATVRAQTNQPSKKLGQEIQITSDTGYLDGIANQMVYLGHVFVTDHSKAKMTCECLVVDLPKGGGQPTNIVASTNVVVDIVDERGDTNHITADMAIYSYHVTPAMTNIFNAVTNFVTAVTNETVTFTNMFGGLARVENPQAIFKGNPLYLDVPTRRLTGVNYETEFKPRPGSGTNASPFNLGR